MTFNIGSQEARVINNVAGDQRSQVTFGDEDAQDKLEQLRDAVEGCALPAGLRGEVRAELDQAEAEIAKGPAHKAAVADRLKWLTHVLASAGALATAGGALIGPLGALAGWLGAAGKGIVDILDRNA